MKYGGQPEESKGKKQNRPADREEFALMALQKAIESKKQSEAWGQFSVKLTWKAGELQTVDVSDQIVYK